ncbi:MAG: hypothetical protein AB1642_00810 [Pseudomonadota bacterium]
MQGNNDQEGRLASSIRHMKRYTPHVIAAATLLLVAFVVRGLLHWTAFGAYFKYFIWIQVAIIALGFYGFWAIHITSGSLTKGLFQLLFHYRLPRWQLVLAVPAVLSAAHVATLPLIYLDTAPDGKPVRSKSWTVENDHHYVIFNRSLKVEITRDEYLESQRELAALFASAWICISYGMLALWLYVWHREHSTNALQPFRPPHADTKGSHEEQH